MLDELRGFSSHSDRMPTQRLLRQSPLAHAAQESLAACCRLLAPANGSLPDQRSLPVPVEDDREALES